MSGTDLTLEQLTDLVGEVSGWGERASITFRREIDRSSVPHRSLISVCVEICGSKTTVSAVSSDHRLALVALLQGIESHHREILRWHKQRCIRAREMGDLGESGKHTISKAHDLLAYERRTSSGEEKLTIRKCLSALARDLNKVLDG